jgi:hypothetical protein
LLRRSKAVVVWRIVNRRFFAPCWTAIDLVAITIIGPTAFNTNRAKATQTPEILAVLLIKIITAPKPPLLFSVLSWLLPAFG